MKRKEVDDLQEPERAKRTKPDSSSSQTTEPTVQTKHVWSYRIQVATDTVHHVQCNTDKWCRVLSNIQGHIVQLRSQEKHFLLESSNMDPQGARIDAYVWIDHETQKSLLPELKRPVCMVSHCAQDIVKLSGMGTWATLLEAKYDEKRYIQQLAQTKLTCPATVLHYCRLDTHATGSLFLDGRCGATYANKDWTVRLDLHDAEQVSDYLATAWDIFCRRLALPTCLGALVLSFF